ncbi:MAG: hypothetical protein EOP72_06200 [Variovorax sp.]|jgi:hypothetical protein|nr:MAG: hypothetical protein EOP72_06200 [Variovorax sp.]
MPALRYLSFELHEDADGVLALEAMASTDAARHADVRAEVERVLDWARTRFPHTHGPVEEGLDWDDDLQVQVEADGWHALTLTLTGSRRFVDELMAQFDGAAAD